MNQRSFVFRAWDGKLNQWAMKEFHLFGETTMFDQLHAYLIETRGMGKALPAYNDLIVTQQCPFIDKEGNPIFEYDILQSGKDFYVVSFGDYVSFPDDWGLSHCCCGWRVEHQDEKDSYSLLFQSSNGYAISASECLVVGNIFQHKHLIEK
jgi:uncharacterized phage protein (TIGR01671 family)